MRIIPRRLSHPDYETKPYQEIDSTAQTSFLTLQCLVHQLALVCRRPRSLTFYCVDRGGL